MTPQPTQPPTGARPRPASSSERAARIKAAAAPNAKAEMLRRLDRIKAGTVAGTLLGFVVLCGLAAQHQVGAAAHTAQAPAAGQPAASGGDFFNQDNSGAQGGYGFDNGSADQPPVTYSSPS